MLTTQYKTKGYFNSKNSICTLNRIYLKAVKNLLSTIDYFFQDEKDIDSCIHPTKSWRFLFNIECQAWLQWKIWISFDKKFSNNDWIPIFPRWVWKQTKVLVAFCYPTWTSVKVTLSNYDFQFVNVNITWLSFLR